MTLLRASACAFRYPQQSKNLFESISVTVSQGDRVGLVGQNGTGKSTLCNVLMGSLAPTSGSLWRLPGMSCAVSAQEPGLGAPSFSEWFAERGYDIYSGTFIQALQEWGVAYERIFCPLHEWSGGERTRAELAAVFQREPDLLILDEPTNHLDLQGLDLLVGRLQGFPGAVILISHDRQILDQQTSTTWWLERGQLEVHTGSVSLAVAERTAALARHKAQQETLQGEVRQLRAAQRQKRQAGDQMQNFHAERSIKKNGGVMQRDEGSLSARANPGKVMRQSKILSKRVLRMESDLAAMDNHVEKHRRIGFGDSTTRQEKTLLWWESQNIGVDERLLLTDLRLLLKGGDRIALVGPNGCGKTLLLNAVAQSVASAGYLRQILANPGELSIAAYLGEGNKDRLERGLLILGSLHVGGENRHQPLAQLSLGERAKVEIVRLILDEPDLLILDEPTNHLSLIDLMALEAALKEFPGAMLVVSHDRTFLQNLGCTTIDLLPHITPKHQGSPAG